jgi:hypothetical protein
MCGFRRLLLQLKAREVLKIAARLLLIDDHEFG